MTALVPLTVADALVVAEKLASSGMVPRDYIGKPAAIYAAIDMGAAVGLRPMQAVQGIAVINGRPSLWGDAALGVVMSHPSFKAIDEDDAATALKNGAGRCKVTREGSPAYEVRFTREMAQTAGLWGKAGPWTQYPGRMLQMRARSWAFRDRFPDALKGLGFAEEAQDAPPIDVTATVIPMPEPVAEPAAPPPPADGSYVAQVLGVQVKDGVNAKTGKPWKRYGVTLRREDGSEIVAGTFSDSIGEAATSAAATQMHARVKVSARGQYSDLESIEPAPAASDDVAF